MPVQSRFTEQSDEILKLRAKLHDFVLQLDTTRDNINRTIGKLEDARATSGIVAIGDWICDNEERREHAIKAWQNARNVNVTCNATFKKIMDKMDSMLKICTVASAYYDIVRQNMNLIPSLEIAALTGVDFHNLNKGFAWFEFLSGSLLAIAVGAAFYGSIAAMVPVLGAALIVVVAIAGAFIAGNERRKAFNEAEDQGNEATEKGKEILSKLQELNGKLDHTFTLIWEHLKKAGFHCENDHYQIYLKCHEMKVDLELSASGVNIYAKCVERGFSDADAKDFVLASMKTLSWSTEAKWSLVRIEYAMKGLTGKESRDVTAVVKKLQQQGIQVDQKMIEAAKVRYADLKSALDEESTSVGSSSGDSTSA